MMRRAHAQLASWRATPLGDRLGIVRNYAELLERRRAEAVQLLGREIGKVPWDAEAEVNAAVAKAEYAISALQERCVRRTVEGGEPARVIRYVPLGVTLVIGPFNFPIHLPGGQILPSLLAGNTVVFKPSEKATEIGLWNEALWREAGLPKGVMQLLVGGAEVVREAIDSPCVGGVFLTGSREAGRSIHRQLAGRYDVLLTLELGGNNPIVVAGSPPPDRVASVLSYSAFASAGQRCTCARRAVFVESPDTRRQWDALVERSQSLRVGMPHDDPPPHIGPLISKQAADSLEAIYRRLLDLGCRPLLPFLRCGNRDNLVAPVIVDATGIDEAAWGEIGGMEWFGPLLVVRKAADFDAAVRDAAETPYGLAGSLIGGTRAMFEMFAEGVGAGVVNWNRPTSGAAGVLPFGGLGDSGNHRPAGYFAADFCSDPVSSLEASELGSADPWDAAR